MYVAIFTSFFTNLEDIGTCEKLPHFTEYFFFIIDTPILKTMIREKSVYYLQPRYTMRVVRKPVLLTIHSLTIFFNVINTIMLSTSKHFNLNVICRLTHPPLFSLMCIKFIKLCKYYKLLHHIICSSSTKWPHEQAATSNMCMYCLQLLRFTQCMRILNSKLLAVSFAVTSSDVYP